LEIKKNGIFVVEMFSTPPQPYKIWSADFWECPNCQRGIVAGFGMQPLSEHYKDDFDSVLQSAKQSGNLYFDYEK